MHTGPAGAGRGSRVSSWACLPGRPGWSLCGLRKMRDKEWWSRYSQAVGTNIFPKDHGSMIQIPEPLLEAIRRHGRESYRDEACGVLFGSQTGSEHGVKEVRHVQPLANSRDGERHRRFLLTPKDPPPETGRNPPEGPGRG